MSDIRIVVRDMLMRSPNINKVHVGWLPQRATLPCMTLNVISDIPSVHLNGPLVGNVARIQIDSWADRLEDSVNLNRAAYDQLHCYQGTHSGTYIAKCALLDTTDRSEPPQDGSDRWTSRLQSDYIVQYNKPLPTGIV